MNHCMWCPCENKERKDIKGKHGFCYILDDDKLDEMMIWIFLHSEDVFFSNRFKNKPEYDMCLTTSDMAFVKNYFKLKKFEDD